MEDRFIYLDYNATTPVDKRVVDIMQPYWDTMYANSSSSHLFGLSVKEELDISIESLAKNIGANANNLIFTSGATESINTAIKGINNGTRKQIVVVSTEHNAVIQTCLSMRNLGYEIILIDVFEDGKIDLDKLKEIVSEQTLMVCTMFVNNETGIIFPIESISKIVHEKGAYLMCDVTQAIGKLSVNVNEMGIDLMPFSAHKFYGPKGIGALYISSMLRVQLVPLIHGGGQQQGFRSGTINVPGIIGMSAALDFALMELEIDSQRILKLRDHLENSLLELPLVYRNGDSQNRIFNTSNLCFPGAESEQMIIRMGNIAVSNGSACSAATTYPSHVLKAMGLSDADAFSSLRFSLGKMTTEDEIDQCIKKLSKIYLELIK